MFVFYPTGFSDSFLGVSWSKGKKKRDRDSHGGRRKGVRNHPSIYRGESGGAREWLTVAPGYLEEGLLHSEAGQQN